jgi:hypothetical protein
MNTTINKLNKPSDRSKLYLWHSKFHDYVTYRYQDFSNAAKRAIGNSILGLFI